MSEQQWSHDGLMSDLATHLKSLPDRMIWQDLQLGPSGSPRPDVFMMRKSYVRPNPIAYECKISRPDFLSDVTSGKWVSYLDYAYAVYFAVPAGLVDKKELPDKCGLMVRSEKGWRATKLAIFNPHPIPEKALIKLLIDGTTREGIAERRRLAHQYIEDNEFNKKFGHEAARWVFDSLRIKEKVESTQEVCNVMLEKAREAVARIRDQAIRDMPGLWNSMCQVLGLQPDSPTHEIQNAVNEIRNKKNVESEQALNRIIRQLERIVADNKPIEVTDDED